MTGGGLLGYFTAAQGQHESVLSMTTDHDNTILVTGDTAGFVKVRNSVPSPPYDKRTQKLLIIGREQVYSSALLDFQK